MSDDKSSKAPIEEHEEVQQYKRFLDKQAKLAKDEVKSVDRKVLAFGMAAVTLLAVAICVALMIALYAATDKYLLKEGQLAECRDTNHTVQRELDKMDGKLEVYEAYLSDRRSDMVRKVIANYIRVEKIKPEDATLANFQQWVSGVGGK